MLINWCVVMCAFLLLISNVQPARILGVFPIPSVSHQIVFQPIWKELSLRGHQVTVLTPNPLRDPTLTNLTEIDLSFQYEYLEPYKYDVSRVMDHWALTNNFEPTFEAIISILFGSDQILRVINDNISMYDVVLAEAFARISYAFGAKFRCPLIGISSLVVSTITHQTLGNPIHPVLNPDYYTPYYGGELTFFEKVDSLLFSLYQKYFFDYRYVPLLDRSLKGYFGDSLPSIKDIERNMSLLLLNTNPIIHGAQLYGPNVIEFGGGIHLKPKKPLPSELEKFLNSSTDGVIYFSLGSNIKSKYLPESKRKILINAFASLPYKVLWKFEDDQLEGKPENVRIEKWLPQQDILGHPNIKLFITQGGLQSLEEALFNDVPLLALPFMADQHVNAKRIQKIGVGLRLDFSTLSEETFTSSILQIVENPKYKEKSVEIRRLLKDQPMTGVEKVVWWTEYVIRNKGAAYLRNPRADISWFEFLLLDVVAFLLFILFATLFVLYKVICFGSTLVFAKKQTRKSKVY